jgi:hypothetical protein
MEPRAGGGGCLARWPSVALTAATAATTAVRSRQRRYL